MSVLATADSPAATAAGGRALAPPAEREGAMAAGVAGLLAPVPAPGTPPGTFLPGLAASRAASEDGRIVRITRFAHAVPGKPEGEVDTRPLRPIWQQPAGTRAAMTP